MLESGTKVRGAIIGVGNCASSLVPGVEFYRNAADDERILALMHVNLGGYHIRMEGTTFGNIPLDLERRLEVWDSPNSAGVVIDAVRCAKIALDRGLKGAVTDPHFLLYKDAAETIHRRRIPGADRGLQRGKMNDRAV